MAIAPIPIYKETLTLGIVPFELPILFSGTVLVVEPRFSNTFIKYFAGYLIPTAPTTEIGEVDAGWRKVWLNAKQFVNFTIPYFPATYSLKFKASSFLVARPFELNIWEVT